MRVDDEAGADDVGAREAARQAFRAEIADAISGIIERDHFLQRLTRRAAEFIGTERAAIYTRSTTGGDLVLRSSTLPTHERTPPRVSADPNIANRDVLSYINAGALLPHEVITVPLGHPPTMGLLVLVSEPGQRFSASDQQIIALISDEVAPAVGVAEHHHAVKQASVIDLTTGAYASWYLTQRFDEEISRAQRTRSPITVVLVSVLNFEELQRAVGYERADTFLRDLATEFAGLTRVFDIVGMRSLSDFAILLLDTDIAGAEPVISRVRQRSRRVIERMQAEYGPLPVQVVTGASAFPEDGDRVPMVLLAAEHRLSENELQHRRTAK